MWFIECRSQNCKLDLNKIYKGQMKVKHKIKNMYVAQFLFIQRNVFFRFVICHTFF